MKRYSGKWNSQQNNPPLVALLSVLTAGCMIAIVTQVHINALFGYGSLVSCLCLLFLTAHYCYQSSRQRQLIRRLRQIQRKQKRVITQQQRKQQRLSEQFHSLYTELEQGRQMALEFNQNKSDFLTHISHELRTPLNAILGFSELLLDHEQDAGDPHYLKNIHGAGKHLLSLIEDLLHLSQLESGKRESVIETIELDELLLNIIKLLQPLASQANIELNHHLDPTCQISVSTDCKALTQILTNLIANGIKFTHEGEVRMDAQVQVNESMPTLVVQVSDSGVGMSQSEIKTVFQPFMRHSEGRIQGTGLGLAICRELSRNIGAYLTVKSQPNKGSQFTLKLPVSVEKNPCSDQNETLDEALTQQTATTDCCFGNNQSMHYPVVDSDKHAVAEPLQPTRITQDKAQVSQHQEQPSVLVIDDNRSNLELISAYLEMQGVEYTACDSGIKGLCYFKKKLFDLVLLDIRMPKMDGYETLAKLQQHMTQTQENVSVIALTASVMDKERESLLRAGFQSVICKPITQQQIAQCIASFTEVTTETKETIASGLNWKNSLTIVSGNEALAQNMLAQLVEHTPDFIKYIEQLESFSTTTADDIHHFLGLVSYTGATRLKHLLTELEQKVRLNKCNTANTLQNKILYELRLVLAQSLVCLKSDRNNDEQGSKTSSTQS